MSRRATVAVGVVVCAAAGWTGPGCGPTSFLITPVPASRALSEHVVLRESAWPTAKVALIDVDGVITNARSKALLGTGGDNPVSVLTEKLDKAADDGAVKAVVLRVNSPGGSVTASDLMYTELRRFRERSGKPVIASLMDVAASGGYYIACAADAILAHPTTVTGSIGVIMMTPDVTGLLGKIGVQANVIKSGEMKDAGSPLRTMSPRERAHFQGMIDAMYGRFVDVVAGSRKSLGRERVRELADGRVYLGEEARAQGLVDGIGTLHDAVAAAKSAAGIASKSVVVVEYAVATAHRPNVYAGAPDSPAQVNILHVELPEWLKSPSPQFLYLWAPEW